MKIKLLPSAEQFDTLLLTMKRFNAACDYISAAAFDGKVFNKFGIHKLVYYAVREQFGLSAQMVIRAIGKVAESYKRDRKTRHTFKPTGAMVYDDRILSFDGLEAASMLTLDGRICVPMVLGRYHIGLMAGRRVRGQADLVLIENTFFLMLVVEVPEEPIDFDGDYLGVDMGIVNIAVDSTGETHSGSAVGGIRFRNAKLRARLQAKGTKSAKRLLRKRSRKEARFARDVNHVISKRIVGKAKALNTGIALEDLTGIRKRVEPTVKRSQRYRQSSWAFFQLRAFIEYKARLNGVPVVFVDPRNTSRTCPACGYVDKLNRANRNDFRCLACGFAGCADHVAAVNIRGRAVCQSAVHRTA
jgi:IS605 OrfB family transposase